MARITVEDCVMIVPNRFELCLVASNRAKSILSGAATSMNRKEKPAVIALREIGDNLVNVDAIKQNIISAIVNRSSFENNSPIANAVHEEVVEEIQSQPLKDDTFVADNLQVDD